MLVPKRRVPGPAREAGALRPRHRLRLETSRCASSRGARPRPQDFSSGVCQRATGLGLPPAPAKLSTVIGDILQPTHLLFILVVALVVLGPKRLPEVGRSLGKGLRDFRGAISGQDEASPEQSVQHLQSGEGQAAPPPGPA